MGEMSKEKSGCQKEEAVERRRLPKGGKNFLLCGMFLPPVVLFFFLLLVGGPSLSEDPS